MFAPCAGFFLPSLFSLWRIPLVADLGDHVGLERHWIYSVDGNFRRDPGDAGSPGVVDVSPNHGAVEIPFRPCCVCPPFASSLVDWREVEHFVRAGRDICGDFQSLLVWLEVVPTFWEDRLEQVWSPVGHSFAVGEFLQ